MDADLQDPPDIAVKLLEALVHGDAQVAFARRVCEVRSPLGQLASRGFRRCIFGILGARLPPDVGFFLAMTGALRTCILTAPIDESLRLAALFALGAPASLVDFERPPRKVGRSGYTLATKLRLACGVLRRVLAIRRRRSLLREHARAHGVPMGG
jgi:dolichol-phosphate mannosyltransferase